MLFTKEFYLIMEAFEQVANKNCQLGHEGLKKEQQEIWHKQNYYCDGRVNNAFIMFLLGYSFGKKLNEQN